MYDDRQLFPGFPGFPGGSPGSGFPGGPPSAPPPGGAPGGGNQGSQQPPPGPPPNFTPQMTAAQGGPSVLAVDPGAIRRCLFRYTYIWLRRDQFWFYPVFIGRRSIAGWRWIGWRWVYFGIDLDNIQSFTCV
ncbi:hypothetical protein AS034_07845 [[Bacillus] enclensis]|jgi:hypothetical protein|uniref:Transporter n=1 Tax=[Bacillus] enclensis TaxID=1402860 RepID=A0A0V8HI12_9BACI|nr:hypothetical protein [[Bacillus] enclensis]KSU62040.1 hypothetical protein AS034_07845 [[Bacillus] enclensis]MBH9966580.1 collagen-like protein [[Bacillus] enclensis]QWC24005.1 collagen-like protein [Bacillus haikouensis]SCB98256.1 hypothetical protein GA0061094_1632 [[Bacillus] enclensis]